MAIAGGLIVLAGWAALLLAHGPPRADRAPGVRAGRGARRLRRAGFAALALGIGAFVAAFGLSQGLVYGAAWLCVSALGLVLAAARMLGPRGARPVRGAR